jgi:diguanylate cyclase (GGDEF)-like protein
MSRSRRSPLDARSPAGRMPVRLLAGIAALVIACGGFAAYRAMGAVDDAYRWTGESEAVTVARGFARSLSPGDLRDPARLRARTPRLAGVHPDLTGAAIGPGGGTREARYTRRGRAAELTFPLLDGSGRAQAVLRLQFSLDERSAALAAGRREVLVAALGALLLLLIGTLALVRATLAQPVGRLSAAALGLAAGEHPPPGPWRDDVVGGLGGALDVLGRTQAALRARIEGLALTDPLTGVLNHRGLHDALQATLEAADRRGGKVAVVVLDLDGFERLNDTVGHAAGDEALRIGARTLQGELRPGDVCGRTGGDEFLLALADTDAWRAERVVERLRSALAYAAAGAVGRDALTFSAGIAEFPRDARDQTALTRLAAGALYRAKRSGRNRCVIFSAFVDAPLSLQEEAERARTAGLANTVYALARAVDLKDGYTHQHSARVAQYAAVLARDLGVPEEEIDQIRTAGILHDVGKVGVADAVLLKPARLTDAEFREMQRHSALGRDIVAGAGMPEIADWVLSLHERWDGGGYPDGLAGEDIPLASRILGVADAFEAMTSSRLYRRGMAVEKALAELERSAGKQFDPAVATRLVALVRSGAIPLDEIDAAHYGSAASSASAAPPEDEGEPVHNVPRPARRSGRPRAARAHSGSAR